MNHFKRNSGLIFKSVTALLLVMGLSSPGVVSSAKHIHHYQVKTNRHVKIHHRRYHKSIQLRKRRSKSDYQIRKICHEIDKQTIHDINGDRQRRHIPKLRLNHRLSRIGNERSYQLQTDFSHNYGHHSDEIQYLLNHRKIRHNGYAENIADSPINSVNALAVGKYNTPNNANVQKANYQTKNGYQLANNINNASMYHDVDDNNGHRNNDLNRHFKQMGVGVSYNHVDQNYYIAIEFIG